MKSILTVLFFCFFLKVSFSQQIQRRVRFQNFGNDSVGMSLNDEYYLIEDSCAQITRYGHFNFQHRKFYGKFTDVSKENPKLIVSEGFYSPDGLKNGEFKSYYLNGKLQAKGGFKDDKYDGKWEMYYDDGKPELTFEVMDGVYDIIDAWKPDGTKTVDKGNGVYIDNLGSLYWKGRLVNGKPDGKWNLIKTDDISNESLASESFKKGQFRGGSSHNTDYTDMSRISLVNPYKLPLVNAEKMLISSVPCNGVKRKHIVGAQYINGLSSFSGYIGDLVTPYLSKVDLRYIDNVIEINGEVLENGGLGKLTTGGSSREDIARGLIMRLQRLPPLHPATVDGKPVRQKFTITFKIYNGVYEFTYRFLPIHAD